MKPVTAKDEPSCGRENADHLPARLIAVKPAKTDISLKSAASDDRSTTSNRRIACYYMPGRIASKKVHFLLDSGCTSCVVGKHVFDSLPMKVKANLQPLDNASAQLADGSSTTIYGKLLVSCKVRDVPIDHEFLVAKLQDDAILGLSFLERFNCSMQFGRPILNIDGRDLMCTDQWGNPMASKVQLIRPTVVPPASETLLVCKLNNRPHGAVGIVESSCSKLPELSLAASLCCPDEQQQVVVRCLNATGKPVTVNAGTVLGIYQSVDNDSVSVTSKVTSISQMQSGTGNDKEIVVPDHLRSLYDQAVSPGLTHDQQQRLARLLRDYADVFSSGETDVGLTNLVKHSIPLHPGATPIRQPPRRLGQEKDQEVERQVTQLQQQGLIEPGDGAWSSPVVLVRKKDGKWRLCVDYRRLNAATCRDAYPLPRIDDSLDSLAGSCYFSTLDLLSGYWQVPLDDDAKEKSAFVTRGGLWQWRVLPFGLTSAPACFERLMERVLSGLQWQTLLLYLDDVIVFSHDFDSHLNRLETVLQRFRSANLKLKPSKCELFQKSVSFLGHIVSSEGVSTDPKKVEAIQQWPTPRCVTSLRTFLGMVGYYRRFCPDMATIAKPLFRLTSKEVQFIWTAAEQKAFEDLQAKMTSAEILGYPDPQLQYILDTDASGDGAGAVLSQLQQGRERVIAYFSKTFSASERNYCVTRKELLAAILAVKHFRSYLYGKKFRLRTDHASLIWLVKRKEPSAQIARWLEFLEEFQFSIEHRPGQKHGNADGLSRRNCIDCQQCRRIELRDGGPSMSDVERSLDARPTPFLSQQHPPTEPSNDVTITVLRSPVLETESSVPSTVRPANPTVAFGDVKRIYSQRSCDAEANVEVVHSPNCRSYRGSTYAEPAPMTTISSLSSSPCRQDRDSQGHSECSVLWKLGRALALLWQVICILTMSPFNTAGLWTRRQVSQVVAGWSDVHTRPNNLTTTLAATAHRPDQPFNTQVAGRPQLSHACSERNPTSIAAASAQYPDTAVPMSAVTFSEVATLQQQGPSDVATIYSRVKDQRPLSTAELDLASPELRKLASYFSLMSIGTDGVLVVQVSHNGRSSQTPVCPPQIRNSIIWEIHRRDHAGVMRTIKRLRLAWFWPGMTSQTRRAVQTCEVCQLGKHSNARHHPTKQHLYSGRPWQRVAIDLVGPMPETPRSNKWILVLTDHFTRWQDALPIPDGTTPVIARTLETHVFCYLGIPEQIHSDQGSQFESALMQELCQLWGVKKTRTTPYHPQGNGMVERQNRTLGDSLRTLLLGAEQTDWDLLLPNLMRSFRATPHSATKETPNYLMFGRETRIPDHLLYEVPPSKSQPVEQYAVELQERLTRAHQLLRERQQASRTDDLSEGLLYSVGDTVYLQNRRQRRGQARKLSSKYVGPYKVVTCYPNHTYEIERNGQSSVQHESRLKYHRAATCEEGRAPVILEPARRPNTKGRRRRRNTDDDEPSDFIEFTIDRPAHQNNPDDQPAAARQPPDPPAVPPDPPVEAHAPAAAITPPVPPPPAPDMIHQPQPTPQTAVRPSRTSGRTRTRPAYLHDYVCD